MNKVKVGVIGVGIQGSLHAWIYSTLPDAELIAVCDLNRVRAEQVAKKYGAKEIYTDYREMLEKAKIDAVSITLPDFLHKDATLYAIDLGKHVLVEKPMATSLEDAREMVSAAKKRGVKAMVNFSNRWSPPFIHAKRAIDNGELGEIEYVYSRLSDTIYVPTKMITWSSKTNVMWFLGSHIIDLTRWLLRGSKALEVYGVKRELKLKGLGIDTPDYISALIKWEGDCTSFIECCWILPETQPVIYDLKFEIIGSEGAMYIDTSHNRCVQKLTSNRYEYPEILVAYNSYGKPLGFVRESIEHFIKCVAWDLEPMATFEDGLAVTEIIEAILESASKGVPVKLSS